MVERFWAWAARQSCRLVVSSPPVSRALNVSMNFKLDVTRIRAEIGDRAIPRIRAGVGVAEQTRTGHFDLRRVPELTSKLFQIANTVAVAPQLAHPTLDGMSCSRSYESE